MNKENLRQKNASVMTLVMRADVIQLMVAWLFLFRCSDSNVVTIFCDRFFTDTLHQ